MNFPFLLPRLLALFAAACFAWALPNPLQAETSAPDEAGQDSAETAEPDRVSRPAQLMKDAGAAVGDRKIRTALRLYRKIIREHSTSSLAPEAHYQSALLRLDRRQWARAFDHFQAIVDSHPEYPHFSQVIRQQYEIAESLRTGARLRLFWRVPGFRSPDRAVEYFEQVVENAPFSTWAPSALIKAAQIQVDQNKLDEAIDLFDRFISDYPRHDKAPDAYFGLAEVFASRVAGPAYDQGANREAISYYEDFVLLFPGHPRAGEAEEEIESMREVLAQSRVVLGDFYLFRRSNFTAAQVFYNEAISISPVSATAEEAREKLLEVDRRSEAQ